VNSKGEGKGRVNLIERKKKRLMVIEMNWKGLKKRREKKKKNKKKKLNQQFFFL
jgi:hypothetical protein